MEYVHVNKQIKDGIMLNFDNEFKNIIPAYLSAAATLVPVIIHER